MMAKLVLLAEPEEAVGPGGALAPEHKGESAPFLRVHDHPLVPDMGEFDPVHLPVLDGPVRNGAHGGTVWAFMIMVRWELGQMYRVEFFHIRNQRMVVY